MEKVSIESNPAGIGTKPLAAATFERHRQTLGLRSVGGDGGAAPTKSRNLEKKVNMILRGRKANPGISEGRSSSLPCSWPKLPAQRQWAKCACRADRRGRQDQDVGDASGYYCEPWVLITTLTLGLVIGGFVGHFIGDGLGAETHRPRHGRRAA